MENEEIVKTKQIKNTPFTLVQHNGENYVAIANNLVFKGVNEEECIKAVEERDWRIITTTIGVFTENIIKQIEEEKTINQKK